MGHSVGGRSLQGSPGVLGNEPVRLCGPWAQGRGEGSDLAGREAGPSPEEAFEFQKESHNFSM